MKRMMLKGSVKQADTSHPIGPEYEMLTDGKTVWINGSDGMCVGRFSNKGADVHQTSAEQLTSGTECLACCHGGPPDEMWAFFCAGMLKHYGLTIPQEVKPS